MVLWWLCDGCKMVMWWLYDGYMLARWVKEANKKRQMERSLLILDAQQAGLQTSVIKIIINKQVDDHCYHHHNDLHEPFSWKGSIINDPPARLILNILSYPARTAWALAAEAAWAAARRERRRRPRSWRRSARAMNIWTGGAMLELVTKLVSVGFLVYWSILPYFLQSGRGRYLGQLTLLALVFFQIRRD